MAPLDPLLALQDLDLRADRLRAQRQGMPEREALEACAGEIVANDRLQASAREKRDGFARTEREVAGEVSGVAASAQDVEGRLYSGEVTVSKELAALQEELRLTRAKQENLEERELQIMEEIEAQDGELERLAGLHTDAEKRSEDLRAAIRAAEEKIDAALEALAGQRAEPISVLAEKLVETYETLRGKPKLAGKAAVSLRDGLCQGCRVSLPRVDLSRILTEAQDALIQCSHCTRLLVR
jgi:predicted  nucleic acid-binding Zn-ribbon protein